MSESLKILVSGDVCGNFSQLYTRVATIQKKAGAFDMLLCVGDFFGSADDAQWQQVMSGEIKVPVATFVLGPNNVEHERFYSDLSGCELHESITYLGRRGIYTGSSGLSIAYLSGVDGSGKTTKSDSNTQFTAADVDILSAPLTSDTKFNGVDILLTSQWPRAVDKYGSNVVGAGRSEGSALIAQLALSLKPRYHFAAMENISYERQPYRNHQVLRGEARHVTRFIALARVANEQKLKFIYAFNLIPMKHTDSTELVKQPPDVTECPYKSDRSLFRTPPINSQDGNQSSQFFYDSKVIERGTTRPGNIKRPFSGDGGRGEGQHRKKPAEPTGPCWFCLASPEVEKHLVVSVGEQCYLALAKGGLTPDHVLITPIGHYQSTTSAPPEVITELERYKSALSKCFAGSGKSMVFFERNFKTQHLQIQAVPVARELLSELKETFIECAVRQSIELTELPKHSDLKQMVPAGAPYFHLELPDGTRMFYRITKGFPLQFGRDALAHEAILNLPGKVDWRACQCSKDVEIKMATSFRDAFKDFDFT